MSNLLVTSSGRTCPIHLEECPAGTLFLGHAPVINVQPPVADAPPVQVALCLVQAQGPVLDDAHVDNRIHFVCEQCILNTIPQEGLTICPTCRGVFDVSLTRSAFYMHLEADAATLFRETIWGGHYIERLFKSETFGGKRILKKVQENYLRHPEKRTWIKVALYASCLIAAWATLCILTGGAYGLSVPLKWAILSTLAQTSIAMKISCIALACFQCSLFIVALGSLICHSVANDPEEDGLSFPIFAPMGSIFTLSIVLLPFLHRIIPSTPIPARAD